MVRFVWEVGPEGWQGKNQREVGPEGQHVRTQSIKDQGSRIKDKDRGSRTRIKDQGSRIKDQGSRMKAGGRTQRPARQDPEDQGSRIMDLVLARMSILEEIRT